MAFFHKNFNLHNFVSQFCYNSFFLATFCFFSSSQICKKSAGTIFLKYAVHTLMELSEKTKGYLGIHHSKGIFLRQFTSMYNEFSKGPVSNLHKTFTAHKRLQACQVAGHFPSVGLISIACLEYPVCLEAIESFQKPLKASRNCKLLTGKSGDRPFP